MVAAVVAIRLRESRPGTAAVAAAVAAVEVEAASGDVPGGVSAAAEPPCTCPATRLATYE